MANNKIVIKPVGFDSMHKILGGFDDDIRAKAAILRATHRTLLQPIKQRLKAGAPRRTGQRVKVVRTNRGMFRVVSQRLRDNIAFYNDKFNRSGLIVGVMDQGFHGRFLEYGTKSRRRYGSGRKRRTDANTVSGTGGGSTGRIEPRKFDWLRKVVNSGVSQIESQGLREYDRLIVEELKKDVQRHNRRVQRLRQKL